MDLCYNHGTLGACERKKRNRRSEIFIRVVNSVVFIYESTSQISPPVCRDGQSTVPEAVFLQVSFSPDINLSVAWATSFD
jgi:hypothetical protein